MKLITKKTVVRIFVLAIVFVVYFKWVNLSSSLSELKLLTIWPLFVAFVFYTIMQIIKADRFYELVSSLEGRISPLKNIFIHLFMPLLGRLTPGKIGEGTKVLLLHADKKNLLFAAIVEKLVDFIVLGFFALWVVFIKVSYLKYYLIFLGILSLLIIMLLRSEWLLNKFTIAFFKKNIFEDKWFLSRIKKTDSRVFVKVFYSTFLGWFANFIACYFLAKSLHMSISLFLLGSMFATAIIVGLLSSLPGGFGAREASLVVLLQLAGISPVLAKTYSVLYVLFILASELFLALVGYILFSIMNRKRKEISV